MAATASPHSTGRGPAVPPEHRPVRAGTAAPGERDRPSPRRLQLAFALAIVLPVLTAVALIPWREEHGRTLALVLVVPVTLVATLGTAAPGVLAALAAGFGYAFFLTAPYQHLRIEDTDEVTTTVTLVVVGIAVGLLSSRLTRLQSRASRREEELRHVLAYAATVGDPASTEATLVADAARHLTALLHLRSCTWTEGEHLPDRPLLTSSGDLMGRLSDLPRDRARLPETCELLAPAGPARPARFVLEPDPARVVSFEERLTAATIASMCSAALTRGE